MGLGPSHPTGQPTGSCTAAAPCRPLLVGEPWRRRPPRTLPRAPLPVPCIACEHASLLYPRPSRSPLPCTRSPRRMRALPSGSACCCRCVAAATAQPPAPGRWRRTWARGGGGRRRAASRARATAGGVEGECESGRRRGRGRRRQAFGAAENRRRREMKATVRALVFIAPPLVAVGEATRD